MHSRMVIYPFRAGFQCGYGGQNPLILESTTLLGCLEEVRNRIFGDVVIRVYPSLLRVEIIY